MIRNSAVHTHAKNAKLAKAFAKSDDGEGPVRSSERMEPRFLQMRSSRKTKRGCQGDSSLRLFQLRSTHHANFYSGRIIDLVQFFTGSEIGQDKFGKLVGMIGGTDHSKALPHCRVPPKLNTEPTFSWSNSTPGWGPPISMTSRPMLPSVQPPVMVRMPSGEPG